MGLASNHDLYVLRKMTPNNPTPYELKGADPVPDDIWGNTWRFLKKLGERHKELKIDEQRMLLQSVSSVQNQLNALAIELGDIAFHLDRTISRGTPDVSSLKNVLEEIGATLKIHNIEWYDPVECSLDGSLIDWVEVLKNIPRNGILNHTVGETLSPIVLLKGKLVRQGSVIGWHPINEATCPPTSIEVSQANNLPKQEES